MPDFSGYSDLRVHSHYSYRDGICAVEDLVKDAVARGRPAMALTDHGFGAGFVELQAIADSYGLQNPIFGVEANICWPENAKIATAGDYLQQGCGGEAEKSARGEKGNYHTYNLVLLARNETGLKNLFKLLTWSGTTGFDISGNRCPILTEEVLFEHNEGLAVLSGGPGGCLSQLLAAGYPDNAKKYTHRMREVFGDRFFVEVLAQQSPFHLSDRAKVVPFARDNALPLVATSDVHYLKPEQAKARDLLWAIADNVRLDNPTRRRPPSSDSHPFELEDLNRIFLDIPEALVNNARLADSCRARLPVNGLIMPDFSIPAGYLTDKNPDLNFSEAGKYLTFLTEIGLHEKYGSTLPEQVHQRLEHELKVIDRAGFSKYILIVADIVQEARRLGILCAPRGSSAGSLVCFAAGISPVNPLDYNLIFERFLNEARLVLPDIDLDIADEARPRLLDYVLRKYGYENVAHIITHNFEGSKSALRDTGKALGTDPMLVNKLVGLVPSAYQRPYSLSRTLEEVPDVARLYKQDSAVKELLDNALLIEGTGRNSGTHAAGVVITPQPIAGYVPLTRTEGLGQKHKERNGIDIKPTDPLTEESQPGNLSFRTPDVMTQWEMEAIEKRGLLKIDLLGLTAWTTIGRTLAFIKQEKGFDLDIWKIPVDDQETYKTISQGYTTGIFQLENAGMTEFATGMKPRNIEDLAFMIAAYRPGPMPFLGKILAVRNGREKLTAVNPRLETILAETYGAPVFQETILKIAQDLAGFSLAEADLLRRAISKKNQVELVSFHEKFVGGCIANGLSKPEAETVWDLFPPFAFYGFNQAHAIVYGFLTYITAYLKVHYSLEYLGALLSVAEGDTVQVVKAVSECHRLKVPLLGPDVNRSVRHIEIDNLPGDNKALRLGLGVIKGLGPAGVDAILAARAADGPFTGLAAFIRRVPGRAVNTRTLISLAKVGALPFGNRAQMEAVLPAAQKASKGKNFSEPDLPEVEDYSLEATLKNESDLLSFHLTAIPVDEIVNRLSKEGKINSFTLELEKVETGQNVVIAGAIMGGRQIQARFGLMFVFNLNDGFGLVETQVLPKVYKAQADLFKEGRILLLQAKVEHLDGRARLQVLKAFPVN